MRGRSLLSFGLAAGLATRSQAVSGNGHSTRYWDCCKPSCAWSGKASVSHPVYTCDKNDNPLSDFGTKSGCESGGSAYTCTNQEPWASNDLVSYGFAATAINGQTESSWCRGCYALTFTSGKAKGKIMLVQSVNTGSDLADNQFDLQIPGGGEGIFDGCSSEFGGIAGARYGGISNRSECASMPSKLQAGCNWRFDWFRNSDNPTFSFTQIQCPTELTARTGCVRSDDASFPKFAMPSATTWSVPTPTATAAAFAQCDSLTWDVASACPAGYYCSYVTDYYWQCAQGTAPAASTKSQGTSSATSSKSASSSGTTLATSTTSKATSANSVTASAPASTAGSGSCTAPRYGQCGGIGWTGCSTCASPYVCKASGSYYSQCL